MKKSILFSVLLLLLASCSRYQYIPRARTLAGSGHPEKEMNLNDTKRIEKIPAHSFTLMPARARVVPEKTELHAVEKNNDLLELHQNQVLNVSSSFVSGKWTGSPVPDPKPKKLPTREQIKKNYHDQFIGLGVSLLLLGIGFALITLEIVLAVGILVYVLGFIGLMLFPVLLLVNAMDDLDLRKLEKQKKNAPYQPDQETPSNARNEKNTPEADAKKTEKNPKDKTVIGWAWLAITFFIANLLIWISTKIKIS